MHYFFFFFYLIYKSFHYEKNDFLDWTGIKWLFPIATLWIAE